MNPTKPGPPAPPRQTSQPYIKEYEKEVTGITKFALIQHLLPKSAPSLVNTAASAPCSAPDFRQFDLWIGDWDAFDVAKSVIVAHARIDPILDGCGRKASTIGSPSTIQSGLPTPTSAPRRAGATCSASLHSRCPNPLSKALNLRIAVCGPGHPILFEPPARISYNLGLSINWRN